MDIAKFQKSCRAAALGLYPWGNILSDLCELIGADKAILSGSGRAGAEYISMAYNHDTSYIESYNSKYYIYDVRLAAARKAKIGDVNTGQQIIPNSIVKDTPYYNNILAKSDIHDSLHAAVLDLPGSGRQSIILHRGFDRALFRHDDVQKMQLLLPYLAEAMQYALKIAFHRDEQQSLAGVTALIGDNFHLRHINGNVQDVFEGCSYMTFNNGSLLPTTESIKNIFLNAFNRAVDGKATRFRLQTQTMPKEEDPSYLQFTISPHPKSIEWLPIDGKTALLNIARINYDTDHDVDMFTRAFGLTNAEAKTLKGLAINEDTRAAASYVGISYKTLRWHLKNIFCKTGYRSQEGLLKAFSNMDISNPSL